MESLGDSVTQVIAEIASKYQRHQASGKPHRWDALPKSEREAKWAEEVAVRKQWGQE